MQFCGIKYVNIVLQLLLSILYLFLQEVVQLPLDFVKQLCLKVQSERPGKGFWLIIFFCNFIISHLKSVWHYYSC